MIGDIIFAAIVITGIGVVWHGCQVYKKAQDSEASEMKGEER